MTRDLEETLTELGPAYRDVVSRLQAAYAPAPVSRPPRRDVFRRAACLAAAMLLLVLGVAALFVARRPAGPEPAYGGSEYRLAFTRGEGAIAEMIRTQNADGSWKNDFLTRQNAEALRHCSSLEAHVAYKKALRNLRFRGIL